MSKRTASSGSTGAPPTPTPSSSDDLLDGPRTLRHNLRHARLLLRERTQACEELSALNQENLKTLNQQAVYTKQLEEVWTNLELALQTLIQHRLPNPPAAVTGSLDVSVRETNANASITHKYPNPVLAMLAARWSELSGRPLEDMRKEMKGGRVGPSSSVVKSDEMMEDVVDGGGDEEVGDVDEDDEDEGEQKSSSGSTLLLEPELQASLAQRASFTQTLVSALVEQSQSSASSSSSPSPTSDAARLALLQSTNLSLQQRLHESTNELLLLNSTLNERDQRLEAMEEKHKALTRKYERLREDIESGNKVVNATANGKSSTINASGAASSSCATPMETDADGVIVLDAHISQHFNASTAKADSSADTHPLSTEEQQSLTNVPFLPPPSSVHLTPDAILKLREDLTEQKLIAESRMKELRSMREAKSKLEHDLHLARFNVLNDQKAVAGTTYYSRLNNMMATQRKEFDAIKLELESTKQRLTESNRLKQELEVEHHRLMDEVTVRFQSARDESAKEIESLKHELLTKELEHDEWLKIHQQEQEYLHFWKILRQEIIPQMEKQLKDQNEAIKLAQTEREQFALIHKPQTETGETDLTKNFSRVMRAWKQQEIALKSELQALRDTSSSVSSSAPSSSTRLSALELENKTLKQRLSDLESSKSDDSQSELELVKELNTTIGEELTQLSNDLEEEQTKNKKLTVGQLELTKMVDKLRGEKSQWNKVVQASKQQADLFKVKIAELEKSVAAHLAASNTSKTLAVTTEQALAQSKSTQKLLETKSDELTATINSLTNQSLDWKSKFTNLQNQHEKCSDEITALRKKEVEATEGTRRITEAYTILKKRLKDLQNATSASSGSTKKSKSSSSSTSNADDAAVIHSLKLLVNCRVCETRQKEKVITRCMHCFCSECLAKNLESRLRKCPQCGLKFGENDIKSIYL